MRLGQYRSESGGEICRVLTCTAETVLAKLAWGPFDMRAESDNTNNILQEHRMIVERVHTADVKY